MSLPGLIERLAASGCSNRDLDADIAISLKHVAEREWWSTNYIKGGMIPAFTGSLDAAVALMEKELPGYGRLGAKGRCSEAEPKFAYQILATDFHPEPDDMSPVGEAEHDIEAIALVMAILRAIESRGTTN